MDSRYWNNKNLLNNILFYTITFINPAACWWGLVVPSVRTDDLICWAPDSLLIKLSKIHGHTIYTDSQGRSPGRVLEGPARDSRNLWRDPPWMRASHRSRDCGPFFEKRFEVYIFNLTKTKLNYSIYRYKTRTSIDRRTAWDLRPFLDTWTCSPSLSLGPPNLEFLSPSQFLGPPDLQSLGPSLTISRTSELIVPQSFTPDLLDLRTLSPSVLHNRNFPISNLQADSLRYPYLISGHLRDPSLAVGLSLLTADSDWAPASTTKYPRWGHSMIERHFTVEMVFYSRSAAPIMHQRIPDWLSGSRAAF